ncbi:hypothetical protein FA15DRAFT_61597 [Coprinopsis marcescibilis]|uniref:Uncharacterized protein n=1 Tax=Coprinopsis marcescibilis TaxID=230819 RepID=A0A5C3L5Z5_COPMA|nr:hypothetical protein FA15DRAFT_61597 [Coprinopsis marcescibilis]
MNTAMDSRTALVDTVGFDSDGISDRETLQELVDWIDYRSSLATARCTLILLRDENHIHHRQLLQGLMRGVAEKCFVRVVTGSDPSNPSYALDENDRPRYQLNTHGAARTSHTTSLQSFCHEVANMADGQSPLSLHEVQQELTKILPKMRGPSPGFKRRSWFSKVFDYIRDTVRAHFA